MQAFDTMPVNSKINQVRLVRTITEVTFHTTCGPVLSNGLPSVCLGCEFGCFKLLPTRMLCYCHSGVEVLVGLGQIREVGSADWVDNLLLEKYTTLVIWRMVGISSDFQSWVH